MLLGLTTERHLHIEKATRVLRLLLQLAYRRDRGVVGYHFDGLAVGCPFIMLV